MVSRTAPGTAEPTGGRPVTIELWADLARSVTSAALIVVVIILIRYVNVLDQRIDSLHRLILNFIRFASGNDDQQSTKINGDDED